MTVEHYYTDGKVIAAEDISIGDPAQKQMLYYSILCNDSTNFDGMEIGDPTETALINLGDRLDSPAEAVRNTYPRLSEIPFDSDRKLMSTLHRFEDGGYTMVTKGAVDVLLERTASIQRGGEVLALKDDDIRQIEEQNARCV